jgi:hypothetical protein
MYLALSFDAAARIREQRELGRAAGTEYDRHIRAEFWATLAT